MSLGKSTSKTVSRVLATMTALLAVVLAIPAGALSDPAYGIGETSSSTTSYPTVRISGHGYGHGRGLSQYGAYGYASGIGGAAGWTSAQILDHFYGGTTAGAVPGGQLNPDPANLRVELLYNRGQSTRVDVELGTIRVMDGATVVVETVADSGQAVRIGASASNLVVETASSCSGPWATVATVSATELSIEKTSSSSVSEGLLRVCQPDGSSTWYDGSISSYNLNGSPRTVNIVPVEQYLRGVVPKEVPASWPAAALEAQAVAARSYVLAGDTRQQPYADSCDTTLCQVYRGRYSQSGSFSSSTHAATDAAIVATAGVVRLSGAAVARTEFSSSSGGYSAGGTFPAIEDSGDATPANSNHDWSTTADLGSFEQATGLGRLTNIEVTERNGLGQDGGRATKVLFTYENGTVTKTGSQTRSLLGLKSDWFSIVSIDRVYTDTASLQYIDHVYQLFLGRSATNGEIGEWADPVGSGQRHGLTGSLAVSDEWAGVMVDGFYQSALGRSADVGGRAHWLGQIAGGRRVESVGAYFYGSPEYFKRVGSSNEGFVQSLYRDLLGREADSGGIAFWSGELSSGAMTPQDVASGFYASIESRKSRVEGLYQRILLRGPDVSGLAYWSEKLLETDDVRLASELAASAESFTISQP